MRERGRRKKKEGSLLFLKGFEIDLSVLFSLAENWEREVKAVQTEAEPLSAPKRDFSEWRGKKEEGPGYMLEAP